MKLAINLAGIELPNPVLVCSGTFGTGEEYRELLEVGRLGGIFSKAVTLQPCTGNPPPRIWETPGGMLNAIGLQNKGLRAFLEEDLPLLARHGVPVIANVAGFSVEEYVEVAAGLDAMAAVSGLELNISCPNVRKGGIHFGSVPEHAGELVAEVRKNCRKPLLVKLSPQLTDIAGMARTVAAAGADGLSLINTFPGMAVDVESWRPPPLQRHRRAVRPRHPSPGGAGGMGNGPGNRPAHRRHGGDRTLAGRGGNGTGRGNGGGGGNRLVLPAASAAGDTAGPQGILAEKGDGCMGEPHREGEGGGFVKPANPLIVALDLPEWEGLESVAHALRGEVDTVKVGLRLIRPWAHASSIFSKDWVTRYSST